MEPTTRQHSRSLFWPVLLIGVGLIWLLANLGILESANLAILFRLWPLVLILVGLDLILGRRSGLIGGLIGLAAVIVVLTLMLAGPRLGLATYIEARTERLTAPLDGARAAEVFLDLTSSPAKIAGRPAQGQLIDAILVHRGEVDFRVEGTERKSVYLGIRDATTDWYAPFAWVGLHWNIHLSPEVPLALTVDGGSGSSSLDLGELQLSSLVADMGPGSSVFTLPASPGRYEGVIDGGSGSVQVNIRPGADLELRLDSGSGSITINLANAAGVRLEVLDTGSGRISVPRRFELIESADGDTGVWETSNYQTRGPRIDIIVVSRGSGSITLR